MLVSDYSGGDPNNDFHTGGAVGCNISQFMTALNLVPTYVLLQGTDLHIYRHASLQVASLTDHLLVTKSVLV